MQGRYKSTTPVLDFKNMALMGYDQDFSPVDDNFSYWDILDRHSETYSFFPRDATAAGTAVSPLARCDGNSLDIPIERSPGHWSSSSSSPFRNRAGFCFCETSQSTEHTEIQ